MSSWPVRTALTPQALLYRVALAAGVRPRMRSGAAASGEEPHTFNSSRLRNRCNAIQ